MLRQTTQTTPVTALYARLSKDDELQGESGMAPVEIGYQPPKRRYARLINLATATPLFAGHFAQVVDFVPTDETQKQQARERYKHYRQAGHTLEMRDQPVLAAPDPAQP